VMLALLATACAKPVQLLKPANGYNVVIVLIDALRADHLGAYGFKLDKWSNQRSTAGSASGLWRKAMQAAQACGNRSSPGWCPGTAPP